MRSLQKRLAETFSRRLLTAMPEFRRETDKTSRGIIFAAPLGVLFSFVYVSPSKSWDAFTLELGWNTECEYPFGKPPLPILGDDGCYMNARLSLNASRTRISSLLGGGNGAWWQLRLRVPAVPLSEVARSSSSEMLLARARPVTVVQSLEEVVDDSCEKLRAVAPPFFHALAAAHQISK